MKARRHVYLKRTIALKTNKYYVVFLFFYMKLKKIAIRDLVRIIEVLL